MTEGYIHVAMREFFKRQGWLLIAGQFPGGTDDELKVLNIVDLELAKDNSPDPRRHSKGKFVPDLLVMKGNEVLVIEAKPRFSMDDRDKLIELLYYKNTELITAFGKFVSERSINITCDFSEIIFTPCLAFSKGSKPKLVDPEFKYLLVKDLENAELWNLSEKIVLESD